MKGLYTEYLVKGVNLHYFINRLKREKITVYSVKRKGKESYFTVKNKDSEKFFAIGKELCYNIYKLKEGGIFYPLLLLIKNVGISVGLLLFLLLIATADGMVFAVKVTGSGKINENLVLKSVAEAGIKKFSFYSEERSAELQKRLYSLDCFSFASVKKRGKTLVIDVETADFAQTSEKRDNLISTADGVLEDCKVYRGRQLIGIGEKVRKGDAVVLGEMQINDGWQKTYVVAKATVLAESYFTFISEKENGDYALALAKESIDYETVDCEVKCENVDGKYLYTVRLTYRVVVICK